MNTTINKDRKVKLRPRRKVEFVNGKPTSPTMIERIIVRVRRGQEESKHELYFDDLTLKEMYSNGFCGPLEFPKEGKETEVLELTAGPIGEFDGDEHGKHVFSITYPETNAPVPDAHVTHFTFNKR